MARDKDPAFLFYDGDASKDVSHMNRLERGCYFDIIQAQRKFHGITMEQARKILGKDFEKCWPALEMILSCEDGVFFIEWVRDSILRRKAHAEKQKKRIQDYWDKKKTEDHGNTTVLPLENVIENENEIVIGLKKEWQISVTKKYLGDKVKIIYDLRTYFQTTKQLEGLEQAGWTKFDEFMKANPSRVFESDDFVYNSYRNFCTSQPNGKKTLTFEELEKARQK